MMRRISALLTAAVLAFALCACGSTAGTDKTAETEAKKIDEAWGVDYYDSSDQNRYVESVYDVSEDEIAGAKICGKFVTCDTRLTGDWKVSTIIK